MRFHQLEESLSIVCGMESTTDSAKKMFGAHMGALRESIKFHAGEVDDLLWAESEYRSLPFGLTSIEFSHVKEDKYLSSIQVCCEEGGVLVSCVYERAPGGGWMDVGRFEIERSAPNSCKLLVSRESPSGESVPETFIKQCVNALRMHAGLLNCFLAALECSNVVSLETPAPVKLNKKRASAGKLPIYSFKTLHLKGGDSRRSGNGQGERDSPRLHLRRGHIRRLPPDRLRKVWVQSCVVGEKSRGVVMKDYALHGVADSLRL